MSNQTKIEHIGIASILATRDLAVPDWKERQESIVKKTSPDSHKRIAKAFDNIKGRLSTLLEGAPHPKKVLQRWDVFLRNNAKVIVLQVGDESSAFQIFETLND